MGDTAIFFYCSDAVLSYTDKVSQIAIIFLLAILGGL